MTDLEKGIVCYVNKMHLGNIYRYDNYQLLHGVRYNKTLDNQHLQLIRNRYQRQCFNAAYELKTYYMENGILSNTIVLKMRPESPDIHEIRTIKIYSELEDTEHEYNCHAIEIFKEHGKYKVFDILNSDRTVWLESYLDNVCSTNKCPREQLRYDMGYLAPAHAFAENMQELSDVMRYLDKTYCIGKPRLGLMNIAGYGEEGAFLSDDIIMDFDEFGRKFGADIETVKEAWVKIYDRIMGIRFNMLHLLCYERIMRDPLSSMAMAATLFDDEMICKMVDGMKDLPGHNW